MNAPSSVGVQDLARRRPDGRLRGVGWSYAGGRVRGQEASFDGVVERRAQELMCVGNGLGREGTAAPAAAGEELLVEGPDVFGS